MSTARVNGDLWGARARDWAELQEGQARALYHAVVDALGAGPGTALLNAGCGTGMGPRRSRPGAGRASLAPRPPRRSSPATARLRRRAGAGAGGGRGGAVDVPRRGHRGARAQQLGRRAAGDPTCGRGGGESRARRGRRAVDGAVAVRAGFRYLVARASGRRVSGHGRGAEIQHQPWPRRVSSACVLSATAGARLDSVVRV